MKERFAAVLIGGLLAACSANTTPPPEEKAAAEPAADQQEETEQAKLERESLARAEMKAAAQEEQWREQEAASADAGAEVPPASSPEEIPLRATVHSELIGGYRTVFFLTLQSVVDEVTVTGTTLNRGNCKTHPNTSKGTMPVKLRFGEDVKIEMQNCGDLLEAQAATDQGNFEFTFNSAP